MSETISITTSRLEQVCQLLDVIDTMAAQALATFLRKLAVLKRLAEILELSGDLITLPDITKFLPTTAVDLAMYERIRANCPGLGLPPAGTLDELTGLSKLQDQLGEAYEKLDKFLNDHPWNRAGFLQDKVDALYNKYITPVLDAAYPVFGILACFKAICDAASQMSTVSDTVKTQMSAYAKQMENSPDEFSSCLTASCKDKVARVHKMRSDLRDLAPQLNPL